MKNFIVTIIAICIIFTAVLPIDVLAYSDSDWTVGEVEVGIPGQIVRSATYIHDIVYGDGKFVAVGGSNNNKAFISETGENWEIYSLEMKGFEDINKVIYDDEKFIAIKDLEAISVSKDGEEWDKIELDIDDAGLYDIVYDGEKYIAVGGHGYIISSENGYDWDEVDSGTDKILFGISYGNGRYVAVGEDGIILISKNCSDWEIVDSSIDLYLNAVIYVEDKFIAKGPSGIVLMSEDGESWKKEKFKEIEDDDKKKDEDDEDKKYDKYRNGKIVYGKDRFIIDDGYISNDGISWDRNYDLGYVTVYGDNKFLTVNDYIKESFDGENWENKWKLIWDIYLSMSSIAYGNDKFVGVNSGGFILSSENGYEWRIDSYERDHRGLDKIVYGDGKFAAIKYCNIFLSDDGKAWDKINISSGTLEDIIYDGERFVLLDSDGRIWISKDGHSWNSKTIEKYEEFSSIIYDGNKYIVMSDDGKIYFSNDGKKWSKVNTNLDELANQIGEDDYYGVYGTPYYGNNRYLLTYLGKLFMSEDTKSWELIEIDSTYDAESLYVSAIEFKDNEFVAFMKYEGSRNESGIFVYKSIDGKNWTKVGEYNSDSIYYDNFYAAVYGDDKYVIGGTRGKTLCIDADDLDDPVTDPIDDEDIKEFDTAYNVSTDKNWKIIFNNKVDEDSINNIRVLNSDGSSLSNIKIELYDSKTIIINPPSKGYTSGEKYTVVVQGVEDIYKNPLKYKFIRKFIIEE